jgi:hypothetical protein
MAATKGRSMFVPNSFQTPNDYVDGVMPHLTGEEFKVLIYAVRRILGFQKRQDRISISQFTDGTRSKDGEVLDSGTGLCISTVKKCLASLVSFNLMQKVGENDPATNEGTLWELQWDETKVNWTALKEREAKKRKVYVKRMKKARSMRQPPTNGIEPTPTNGIEGGGANGIETQKTEDIQRKTVGASALSLSSMPLDWKLAHGETVTEEDVKQASLEINAPLVFEKAFGFGTLPWGSNSTWTKFQKFITKLYAADPRMFADYVAWRAGDGKYKAFSNRKIRENPIAFMDTGYPEFEASKMYSRPNEAPRRTMPVFDSNGRLVVNA